MAAHMAALKQAAAPLARPSMRLFDNASNFFDFTSDQVDWKSALAAKTAATASATWQYLSLFNVLAGISGFLLLQTFVVAIYRLYFHPLAKFPGPKIAALTRLYEFYWQAVKITEFPEVIRQMHEKYGPVVRISPEELSINDSKFNVEYFTKDRKLDKDPWYYTFGFKNSLFTLLDKPKHRERQGHLAAHFSGPYFQKSFPMMNEEIQELCNVLGRSAKTSETLNVSVAYRKMTNEIQRNFLLGPNYPASKDYAKDAKTAYNPLFRAITWIRHFPILRTVHDYVPAFVYESYLPMAKYAREAEVGIKGLVDSYDRAEEKSDALLYRLIEEDPSYRDNNCVAAVEEFMELLWGGREVMAHSMTTISYFLMSNPECMAKLREELNKSKIDLSTATYGQLQHLPYLYGVCKEGIRMQLGGGFRIPRINKEPVVFKDWVIPANTPISMCPNFFHFDPEVFEDPWSFKPERWNQGNREELEHYWKPFGNGSRSCAGRNMALEVVFRTTANVFSKYVIDFDGLDAEFCKHEGMLKVFPHGGSTGLTVSVQKK